MKNNNTINSKKINNISKVPKSIILTGKILQFVNTSLATKFAVKLFGTPIKFKTPEREKMMANSAQKEKVLIPSLSKEVMVYSYGYSKKKALLIHGWSGRGTQLYRIADKLLENEFMTISFDGPAHGESSGKTTMMTEFNTTALFLEEKYGPFEIVIGHSLGGMSALNSIKLGLQVKKAIIIGAGDIITDIVTDFVKKIQLKPSTTVNIKKLLLKKTSKNIDDYSVSIAAKHVTIPTLVIHDTEDYDVPVSCASNIRQNLKQGEILITNGLGHRRILKDNLVIDRIIEFINRN